MAKKRAVWSEDTYNRRIAEGRGQNTGKDYLPWITIHDLASKGIVTRTRGMTTGRVHHTLSGLETDYLLELDYCGNAKDIREQFPLILKETLNLAWEHNIRHPRAPGCSFPTVMTTDFLVTLNDGTDVARAIKQSKDLDDKRTCEKLMLEKYYWENRNVDWKIVTEKEINRDRALNLRWLYYGCAEYPYEEFSGFENAFLDYYRNTAIPFSTVLEIIEEGFSLEPGAGMSIFKQLVLQKKIRLDINKPISKVDPRKNDLDL